RVRVTSPLGAALRGRPYGTRADTYLTRPVARASMRYGMFDWLTLEGHAEGGAGLANVSAGIAARTGSFGVASAAFAASPYASHMGYPSYPAHQTRPFGLSMRSSSQMTFRPANDLAPVTAQLQQEGLTKNPFDVGSFEDVSASVANAINASLFTSARPPKALNRVSVGAPLPFARANLSGSFVQTIDATGLRANIVAATLSAGWRDASIFATAFKDLSGVKNTGFLVGGSMPI